KTLSFRSNIEDLPMEVDPFHFENAITNLIDNALKYGGNTIEVNVAKVLETVEITVSDNGNPIDKSQREKIFDQFYRIPKGNTHDVKGFGIGLYYTKKIIEKHNGTIQLVPNANHTIFKITLLR
ncbi:MAG: sensor histidine kinase, partial [Kordia sp.]|uniref:sensor histidine kinase n=1 Tax=Kordia sp. TaxID=1965332 RepID=UPI003858662E